MTTLAGQASAESKFTGPESSGPRLKTTLPVHRAPEDGCSPMLMKDLHRLALENGGDSVNTAMGQAEAQLAQNPSDPLAKAYKGSLLTMVGSDVLSGQRRREYLMTGMALMVQALNAACDQGTDSGELLYVVATSAAMLPADFGRRAMASTQLKLLVGGKKFKQLDAYQRLRALTLASCLEQASGRADSARRLFEAAKSIDTDLAVRLCCNWLEMDT
jgi:hypothetical protein